MKPRHWLLMGALVLTVYAAIHVSDAPTDSATDVVAATEKKAASRTGEQKGDHDKAVQALPLDQLQRGPMDAVALNPFQTKTWFAAPPPPSVTKLPPQPIVKPSVPALPFVYVGKLEQDAGHSVVYLAKGEETYTVKQGDTFDNDYRFESIENGNMIIQYLPLAVKQMLPISIEN